MKYICASCKTIYDESELNIDPMSSIQTCPKCGRIGSGVYSEEELVSEINDYIELFQILNESTKNKKFKKILKQIINNLKDESLHS